MICKSLRIQFLTLISVMLLSFSASAEVSPAVGKSLFKANCASCHNKNMKDDLTGPALGGVQERWEGREETLYAWIRNSQQVVAAGDEYAVNLFNKWDKSVMTPFPNLTDDEVASLLVYVQGMYDGSLLPKTAVSTGNGGGTKDEGSNTWFYVILLGVLSTLALILARIVANLDYLALSKAGNAPLQRKTLADILTSGKVVGFGIFALIILLGYTTITGAIDLNRQQNYAPEQPIKFSHAMHAGLQKIDCQYCHDGARRSKHSVIPAANTCMNCHKAIKKGSKDGTAELTKIFASTGFDPSTDKYIENYDEMDMDKVAAIYKKWIGDTYTKDNKLEKLDKAGMQLVEDQWDGVVASLTNDVKDHVGGPIPWVRIHNLPDHVYFNHSQHVNIGKVECQNCHGKVEEMETAYQYAPLSMGWCINCHRNTEVQFSGNEYYESYKKYHDEVKNGKREKVTVEDIGGLECQKCHY